MSNHCEERPIMCFISRKAGEVDGEIVYCPVHAAAPELMTVLRQTQTLLALICNDPGDPTNGGKAADQFNRNKAAIAKAKV